MTYDARSRDRYRWAVTGLSGAVAAGVLVGTGAVAGQAARQLKAEEEAEQARRDAELATWQAKQDRYKRDLRRSEGRARRGVVLKQRPTATRVTTRYVDGSSRGGPVAIGSSSSGGTGDNGAGGGGGSASSSGSGSPAPAPAPPPPPPPPASSGS